jgi:hypothetical protein
VFRVKTPSLPTTGLKSLALASGLPSQALGDSPDLRSFNLSWKDTDGLTWSFDSMGRNLSFWKEMDYRVMDAQPEAKIQQPATLSDEEIIAIATDFMTRHGFGTSIHGTPIIDHPWKGIDGTMMPCPVPLMKPTDPAAGGVASDAMMIAPCGGYPQVISITYPLLFNGQEVYDMGGWPSSGISLQVDLSSKQVTGGNIWPMPDTDSSTYPLIGADEAMKRLSTGGRNPLYWYGEDVTAVRITIDKVTLAWMRYDAWDQDGSKTFFLPALRGTGTQDYGNGKTDAYNTIVPLVADDAFGGATPPPVMLMNKIAPEVTPPPPAPKPAY